MLNKQHYGNSFFNVALSEQRTVRRISKTKVKHTDARPLQVFTQVPASVKPLIATATQKEKKETQVNYYPAGRFMERTKVQVEYPSENIFVLPQVKLWNDAMEVKIQCTEH